MVGLGGHSLSWTCGRSMMCDQLKEHTECAIFPEDKETQTNHHKWEDERASAFEYLSDYGKVRNRIAKHAPNSYKQEKENQVDSTWAGVL